LRVLFGFLPGLHSMAPTPEPRVDLVHRWQRGSVGNGGAGHHVREQRRVCLDGCASVCSSARRQGVHALSVHRVLRHRLRQRVRKLLAVPLCHRSLFCGCPIHMRLQLQSRILVAWLLCAAAPPPLVTHTWSSLPALRTCTCSSITHGALQAHEHIHAPSVSFLTPVCVSRAHACCDLQVPTRVDCVPSVGDCGRWVCAALGCRGTVHHGSCSSCNRRVRW
jgi:hypothetical protein